MTKYIRSGKKKVILFTVTIFLSFLSLNNSFSQKAQFSLYAVTDLERVFEDGYKLPEINPSIEVFGIRVKLFQDNLSCMQGIIWLM